MDIQLSLEQNSSISASEISSIDRLLESGFLCVRQGCYAEGLALLAVARRKLSPTQTQLATALDELAQNHITYLHTQEALLQASRKFVRADTTLQAQIASLGLHLSHITSEIVSMPTGSNASQQQEHILSTHDAATGPPPANADDHSEEVPSTPSTTHVSPFPDLYITCFGHFEVKRLHTSVTLCTNRHGQTILRYLVAHAEHRATGDTLMALLWPEDEVEVARPRLHTSICALRRSLNADYTSEPGGGYIICKNRMYGLNPAIPIQTDVDQFLRYYQVARQSPAERYTLYENACRLYSGPFLAEDRYADWSSLQREHLCRLYIDMCRALSEHCLQTKRYEEAEHWANAVLKENQCDEQGYQQLMRIYSAQGHRSEIFQQYQRCERVLREELSIAPMPETTQLMQTLLTNTLSRVSKASI